MAKSTEIQKRINRTAGRRQNYNGAGEGGRLVAANARRKGAVPVNRGNATVTWGSRNQRYRDIRGSLGLAAG